MLAEAGPIVDPWATAVAGIVTASVLLLVGAWKMLVMRRDYDRDQKARDERCDRCEKRIGMAVTTEVLKLELDPIRAEQDHRKRSMEILGRAVSRMDRKLTALLVAAKIDVREFESPEESSDR